MKKTPIFFSLLLFSCSTPKQIVTNVLEISKYKQPYYVFAVGKWNKDYVILTLTDANNNYFTVKVDSNVSIKKGDVYKP